jgi:hypothetical protein
MVTRRAQQRSHGSVRSFRAASIAASCRLT